MKIKEIKNAVKGKMPGNRSSSKSLEKSMKCPVQKPGQELAFALMGIASTLSIVGFTMDKLEIRLSNVMAFDANIIGTWGCKPELYADVLKLVSEDKLTIKPFTETFHMSKINEIFQRTLEHKVKKRIGDDTGF